MARPHTDALSRRERQVMDVLHRLSRASVAQVQEALGPSSSYAAVRALLRTLRAKGHVRHIFDGPRHVYEPVISRPAQTKVAMRHLVRTLFGGSTEDAVVALVESADVELTPEQLDALARRIASARTEGR